MKATLVNLNSSTTSSGELKGIFYNFEIFLRSLILFLCTNIKFGNNQSHYDEVFTGAYSKAVVQWCSVKKVFSKISQNSQENTCARASILIKLHAWGLELY